MDPRLTGVNISDLRAQFDLASRIRDQESAANEGVLLVRELKAQVADRLVRAVSGPRDPTAGDTPGRVVSEAQRRAGSDALDRGGNTALDRAARLFVERVSAVEAELYQVRNQSPKDKIAFPIKLNDRLTGLRSRLERGDAAPTAAYLAVFEELSGELAALLEALDRALAEELPRLNRELSELGLPRIDGGRPTV